MNRLLVLGCIALVLGCSGASGGASKKTTHKVSGKLTMGGAPVAGATITFSPKSKDNPPAMGLSDAAGVYVLTTYDAGDGAVEGDYKVMVYKAAPKADAPANSHNPHGGKSAPTSHSGGGAGGAPKAGGSGSLLPEKYSTSETPIEKSVKAGTQTIDIEL